LNSFSQNLDSLYAVSVNDSNNIEIYWASNTLPSIISNINVLRMNTSSQYDKITGKTLYSSGSMYGNNIIGLVEKDQSANPDITSYNYKLQLIKDNGDTVYSMVSNSIYLSWSKSLNDKSNFTWNSHIGVPCTKYYILRQLKGEPNFSIYDSTNAQITSYTDMKPDVETTNYRVCAILDRLIYTTAGHVKSDWGPINSYSQTVTIPGTLAVAENQSSDIEISPNPAKDRINIESEKQIKSITVSNILGQNIAFQTLLSNEKNVMISTNNFVPGIYIITINTGDKQIVKSVMVK